MPSIAVLYDRVRWEEKAIINELSSRDNVRVETINILDVRLRLYDGNDRLNFDLYHQRAVSFFKGLYSTLILENLGCRVVNSFKTSLICGNKLLTTLALTKTGVPTPKTIIAFSEWSALKAIEDIGYPAMLKPIYGSWGRLVAPLNDPLSAKAIIESRLSLHPLYQIFYVQEKVKRPPRDIRTFVIGDEVITGIYRVQPDGEWRTNTHLGGKALPCKLTDELVDISLKAAESVGSGILGIDIMEGPDGLLVHEVNHVIEFRNTVRVTGVDLPRFIADYLIKEAKM